MKLDAASVPPGLLSTRFVSFLPPLLQSDA